MVKNIKKTKYSLIASSLLGLSLLSGTYAANSFWNWHNFDKYVTKQIEIAANAPSIGNEKGNTGISMHSSLVEARENVHVSPLENTGIIWQTPITDVGVLDSLLEGTIQRTEDIQYFKESFSTGIVNPKAPLWVQTAHDQLSVEGIVSDLSEDERRSIEAILPTIAELSSSEIGQRIGSEYEAVNVVVGGGSRASAKNLEERHKSLIDTLKKAGGWRSIIRFQADDYKQAHAHVFVGYLLANQGYLDKSIEHFSEARELMGKYPDDKNLAIIRDTPELEQKTIKGLIDSSIKELEDLNEDPSKYSTGWWKRLRYYNQSIGGQNNPSIQDVSELTGGRYFKRGTISSVFGLTLFYLGGGAVKRRRNAGKYEVPITKVKSDI